MKYDEFKSRLKVAKTEETVKAIYAQYFSIKYDTADRHDLYTAEVLFEFKYDKNFHNLKALATILAQILYYVRRLKFGDVKKTIPFFLCLADKNEASITETNKWSTYYSNDNYDWERAPSNPDPKLIDHLVKEPETEKLHIYRINIKGEHTVFKRKLENVLNPQTNIDFGDKKIINENNFEAVFDHWKTVLGKNIVNGYKDSFYFLSNIQEEKINIDRQNNRVVFTFEDNHSKDQKVLMNEYDYFWGSYEYVKNQETINGIHAKLDRLSDETQRRFEGEFFTPIRFADKAINYLTQVLGEGWYKTGKYRIWDMAAGTGNLEYNLPAESYKYLYLSTLHAGEADHLNKVFQGATCFQYDYLNDDVEHLMTKDGLPFKPAWKLPKKLRDELKDASITWVVYINPPFATAQDARQKQSKTGVSKTKVEVLMDRQNIGHTKRELFAQFMFRITNELPSNTFLGMFSTLKYLNAPDSVQYRNNYFNYEYKKGFLFHSKCFQGITGHFPIGFLIWNLSKSRKSKSIKIDISDDLAQNVGVKHLALIEKDEVINKWFARPKNTIDYILPPLSNGITLKGDNADLRHRARPDFLASLCSKGNDFQNSKYVVILSSPSVSAGAFTVNEDNFEKALTLHAVRKVPKSTWLNDRNQFLIPRFTPPEEFTIDCVIWSLFASSNQTTSLSNVEYLGRIYQIKNNFFPFLISELNEWEVQDVDIKSQLSTDEDRYVAKWIESKELSAEAFTVLSKGRDVYKFFYAHLNEMMTHKWKIENWDSGWYQIKMCLKEHNLGKEKLDELKVASDKIAKKILPQIEVYGFLDKDEIHGQEQLISNKTNLR